jgi:phosphatidylglycerol:prolipoprotein diacylglycerol transferase
LQVSLCAIAAGSVAAKIWFVLKKQRPWGSFITSGMCVQGFLVGTAVVSLMGLLVLHMQIGGFYDATAPGLFFGLAIGRFGCFFGGCCAGRPTGSRWGVWSSDGRLGIRRIPTQLLESFACFLIGVAALSMQERLALPGALFLASWVAYTLFRQSLIFSLRAESLEPSIHPGLGPEALETHSGLVHSEVCGILHDEHQLATEEQVEPS